MLRDAVMPIGSMTSPSELDPLESTDFRQTWRSRPVVRTRQPYLTVLNGKLVGRTFRVGSGRLIVGRADDCDIVLKDEGVSRRHALLVATPDGKVVVEDLRSTNGTTINGTICNVRVLQGAERLQFGSATVFKFDWRDSIEEQFATYLYESATQDRLTGVHNERYFRDQLQVEFAWHRRRGMSLSLIFLDVDHFKMVNDSFGHIAGDAVLKQVAARCHAEVRSEDLFARYGGEEFACLLRQTDLSKAVKVAEAMRQAVRGMSFRIPECVGGRHTRITLSAGIAEIDESMTGADALIAAADGRLYESKSAGRDRVSPALENGTGRSASRRGAEPRV